MKSITILAIVAASVLLIGCGKRGHAMGHAMVARTKNTVATSQVVVYASTDRSTATNIFLTVKEIWKGSEQASRFGISNRMQFSEKYSSGNLPEGAIVLLSVDTNRYTSSEEVIWVRSGRVENMTVQEFKTEIGL